MADPATEPAVPTRDGQELAGLATIAALTFLAARAVPGGFVVALVGGVPLARAAQQGGPRAGFATGLASLAETVAVMGPARLIVPLPHAVSAPLLGVLMRGRAGWLVLAAAGAAVRFVLYVASFGFYVFVLVGVDAYLGTYGELRQLAGWLPAGTAGALWATVAFNAAWSSVGGGVQAWVLRRGLRRWPAAAQAGDHPPTPEAADPDLGRAAGATLNGRAVVAAGVVAFLVAVATTEVAVLAVVGVWLVGVWLLTRAGVRPVLSGLALAAPLALSTAAFALVGGVGAALAGRRTARVVVLVLVAVWLRAAAGPAGLRATSVLLMRRIRRAPTLSLAGGVLAESAGAADYAAPVRRLGSRLHATAKRPVRILDATLAWVADEAGRLRAPAAPAPRLPWTRIETALVASAGGLAVAAPVALLLGG